MPTRFIALLSDIHANIDALDAVLDDLKQWPVAEVICLGDIIGRGAEPAACVERLQSLCSVSLLGNHEKILSIPVGVLSKWGQFAIPENLAREQLSPYQETWLRTRPLTWTGHGATFCHASLHEPEAFHYIDSHHEAQRNFGAQRGFLSFHGHTHIPAIWQDGGPKQPSDPGEDPIRLDPATRHAICVGSVGQPRDGDPRASYFLYAPDEKIVFPRRVRYDVIRARKRLRDAGLPDELGGSFTLDA